MNIVVGIVAVVFIVFVFVVALRGRKARKDLTSEVCDDLDFIYEHAQRKHKKRMGRASTELSNAHASHHETFDGRVSASK
ncbi:MAG TPA: hypothetical protein VMW52_08785 [Phycisphaerae bacterium]|nr:hypothetical protein [Phycisphaerae bacterium]